MRFCDSVYGEVEITEPVILDLINSDSVVRLKNITQHGASVYNKHYVGDKMTRYEHSLGVYLFLRKFSCSLEEQIAGLLHDVGHTVFSHVIDYIFISEHQDHDKKNHANIIANSDIPSILAKHKINLNSILDDKNFPILEKNLPDLCADRIDYCLRVSHFDLKIDENKIINDMEILDNQIVFNNKETALVFAEEFMRIDQAFWAYYFEQYLYHLLAEALKLALHKKYLQEDDLYKTENVVMEKLETISDKNLKALLGEMKNVRREDVLESYEEIPGGYSFKNKARTIDPLVKIGKSLARLTELDDSYRERRESYIKKLSNIRWIGRKDNARI
jgi:HD superfamily phosphohydrolase